MTKIIHIQYFAIMREQRGLSEETLTTSATTARELYQELLSTFHFTLSTELVRVAINNEFKPWDTQLEDKDQITFIPPVAGG